MKKKLIIILCLILLVGCQKKVDNSSDEPVNENDKIAISGTITVESVGLGPVSATITQENGMDCYNITMGTIPLKGGKFAAYYFDDSSNVDDYLRITNDSGLAVWEVDDVAPHIQTDDTGDFVRYIICGAKTPKGYFIKESLPVEWGGNMCRLFKDGAPFDISLTGDNAIVNNNKIFSVVIQSKDGFGNQLNDLAYGLFTTEPITLYEGDIKEIPAGSLVSYGKTNDDGVLMLGSNLLANQNYVLKEMSSLPDSENRISSISIDENDKTSELDNNEITIDLTDFIDDEEESRIYEVDVIYK